MKALIADDDSLMRIALKTLINWEGHGITLVGEAADGVEALSLIRKHQPDILLLDMKMPRMDGIEVLQQIQTMADKPHTIILSSYNEFELVKNGMRLGAEDYLLKGDLDFDKLAEQLETLTQKVLITRANSNDETISLQQSQKTLRILRAEFYRALAERFYSFPEDLERESKILDIRLGENCNYCFFISTNVNNPTVQTRFETAPVMGYALVNVAEEILGGSLEVFGFERNTGEYCVFAAPPTGAQGLLTQQLVSLGQRLVEMVYEYLNLTVYVGIGIGSGGASGAQTAYDRARMASFCQFNMGEDRVQLWEDAQPEMQGGLLSTFPLASKTALFEIMDFRDEKKLSSMINEFSMEIQSRRMLKDTVNLYLEQLYFMLAEYFLINELVLCDILIESHQPAGRRFEFENATEAVSWLNSLAQDLTSWFAADMPGDNLEIAKKYMHEHYTEDISLGKTAQAAGLSPAYLSNQMKKHCNKSYSEYLIDLRIEKAKQLLQNTNLKMYEVGEQSGYLNAFYFTRIFKRETGLTPSEYRASNLSV